ncbi:hypothetical protein HYQ46_006810 [Verticillium longisporum]|nr:hypothetical protein HYQ46_006810 [Verticillium longisporum]
MMLVVVSPYLRRQRRVERRDRVVDAAGQSRSKHGGPLEERRAKRWDGRRGQTEPDCCMEKTMRAQS